MFIAPKNGEPEVRLLTLEYYDGKTLLSMAGERIRDRLLSCDSPLKFDKSLERGVTGNEPDAIEIGEAAEHHAEATVLEFGPGAMKQLESSLYDYEGRTTKEAMAMLAFGNLPGFTELAHDRLMTGNHAKRMLEEIAAERDAHEQHLQPQLEMLLAVEGLSSGRLTLE